MSELEIQNLAKRYGGLLATDNLSMSIEPGELHAVIGPNGAGKTTLIKQLSGELLPTEGRIFFKGAEVTHVPVHERAMMGIARSYQITSVFDDLSVAQNVALSVLANQRKGLRMFGSYASDRAVTEAVYEALEQIGLLPLADDPVSSLAYGAKRQLEVAMALAMKPKVLLLDEPMAGMSRQESDQIISLIDGLKGRYAILLVEHDMDAIFALADRVTVLVYGRAIATGGVAEIKSDPRVREAYLGTEDD